MEHQSNGHITWHAEMETERDEKTNIHRYHEPTTTSPIPPWQDVVAKKQAQIASALPKEWRLQQSVLEEAQSHPMRGVLQVVPQSGLLTQRELDITEKHDATALLGKLAAGTLTSYEVTLAFCKRAAIAHQLTHCLTEIFFDRALETAKERDAYLAKTGKIMGPFHGLPISVKDLFHIKGIHTTIGYVSHIQEEPSNYSSVLVELLASMGAVFYVKTNIPQTMMIGESVNNIFGRVLCPHNLDRVAGGSSGGEGALVAMRGSPLGVGTDIAGSVRIPALCDGIFGFTPSVRRVPYSKTAGSGRPGSPAIAAVAGPLASSARDLTYFMQHVIEAKPWIVDPLARAIPWTPVSVPKKLTIGLLLGDPLSPLSPPIRRALTTAAAKLSTVGHSVISLGKSSGNGEVWPVNLALHSDIALDMFGLDPEKTALKKIAASGEPTVKAVADIYNTAYNRGTKTIDDVYALNVQRQEAIVAWHTIFQQNGGFDVLLAPGHATPSTPHDEYGVPYYTMVWNLVERPAAIIPYLTADKAVDLSDTNMSSYNADFYHGAPCHVQVVGHAECDEELAAAVEMISSVLEA